MTQTTIQTTTTQTQPAAGGFPRQRQADPTTRQERGVAAPGAGALPGQRTVAREGPASVAPITPAAADLATHVRGRAGLRALVTRVLRGAPATADQVEQAATRAAWARQRTSAGHADMLLVSQPFLRSLK